MHRPDLFAIAFDANVAKAETIDGRIFEGADGGQYWKTSGYTANQMSFPFSGRSVLFFADRGTWVCSGETGSGFRVVGAYWFQGQLYCWDALNHHLSRLDPHQKTSNLSSKGIEQDVIALWIRRDWWAIELGADTSRILHSSDSGETWQVQLSLSNTILTSIYVAPDGRRGWAAGPGGVLFRTNSASAAGEVWLPASQNAVQSLGLQPVANGTYGRLFAPWFAVLVLISGGMIFAAYRLSKVSPTPPAQLANESQPAIAEQTIGNQGISDRPLEPGDPDALELGKMAEGLSFFLANDKTKPPLVIAINGRWGSGKSSLMNLLTKKLERYGAHPVWFNAWHHQKEDQMLAALLQAVKTEAVPPFYPFSGIGFRWRLLRQRLKRHWPYISAIVAGIYLLGRGEHYLMHRHFLSIWSMFAYLFHLFQLSEQGALHSETALGPVTVVAGVVAAVKVLSGLLTAFGANPATLLTSVAGTTRRRDLEAQTSFRQRFASEFHDVTTSFSHDHRMAIVIDDLDRCRPEKVREVLEGVNFLVSSGDCFVVLGMAREIVEQYVALSFRNVVDEIGWDALGLSEDEIGRIRSKAKTVLGSAVASTHDVQGANSPTIASGASTQDERRKESVTARDNSEVNKAAKRLAFAELYLQKLVQIEVTIPAPTSQQQPELFETDEERSHKQKESEQSVTALRAQQRIRAWRMAFKIAAPVFQIMVVTAALIACGITVGRWLLVPTADQLAEAAKRAVIPASKDEGDADKIRSGLSEIAQKLDTAAQAVGKRSASGSATAPVIKSTGQETRPVAVPPPGAATARGSPSDESGTNSIKQGQSGPQGWASVWPLYPILFVFLVGLWAVLTHMPSRKVTDTEIFTNALKAWYPLIMTGTASNTPRTAKRFQNRVRYLAMRQRAMRAPEIVTPGEKLLRWLANAPSIPPTRVSDRAIIPEPILVGFAAIEQFEPALITDHKEFDWLCGVDTPAPDEPKRLVRKCQSVAAWSRGLPFEDYRRAYQGLCGETAQPEPPMVALTQKSGT